VSKSDIGGNPSAADVRKAFTAAVGKEKGKWTVSFIFDRDGKFYVDVFSDPSELVDLVKTISIGGKQVPVHRVEEAPYFLLQLENIPSGLATSKIFNYFKNEVKVFVGQIKVQDGHAFVPMLQADFQACLSKKFITIDNTKINVREKEKVAPSEGTTQKSAKKERSERNECKIPVKIIEGNFLKKKKKEEMDNIASEFSVKIRVAYQKAQYKKTDSNSSKEIS